MFSGYMIVSIFSGYMIVSPGLGWEFLFYLPGCICILCGNYNYYIIIILLLRFELLYCESTLELYSTQTPIQLIPLRFTVMVIPCRYNKNEGINH